MRNQGSIVFGEQQINQAEIDEVVATVPNWAEDISVRIERKLLDPSNKYSQEELKEMYPTWMVGYAVTAFDSEDKRNIKIQKEIKREARDAAKNIDQLKEVNQVVLSEKLSQLPVYA